MFWCVVSLYIFTPLYFHSPYGLVKHGTTRENIQRYYTPKHLIRYIYIYFAPNGGYCICYPSNIFRNMCGFENWGYHPDILQF